MKKITLTVFLGLAFAAFGQEGGGPLSEREAKALERTANSPQDHRKLADFYQARAARERVEAEKHLREAEYYREHPTPEASKHGTAYGTEEHCRRLSGKHARAAANSQSLAHGHAARAGN